MATTSNRVKLKAAEWVAASLDEADAAIAEIGSLQRQREAIQTKLNERLARVKEAAEHDAAPIAMAIRELSFGVQTYCEANRDALLNGSAKTIKLGAGEVSWRVRPPSVNVRAAEAVIAALKKLNLYRFIRTKEEVDKSAILRDPAAVDGIKGIAVSSTGEDFIIQPFSTLLEEVS